MAKQSVFKNLVVFPDSFWGDATVPGDVGVVDKLSMG